MRRRVIITATATSAALLIVLAGTAAGGLMCGACPIRLARTRGIGAGGQHVETNWTRVTQALTRLGTGETRANTTAPARAIGLASDAPRDAKVKIPHE